MTVVSAMRFNSREGAIVADEQSSATGRKYDIATKIHELTSGNVAGLLGGSGMADVLYDALLSAEKRIKGSKTQIRDANEFAEIVASVMSEVKRAYIAGFLRSRYGISEAEFQTGKRIMPDGSHIPIEQTFMQDYAKALSDDNPYTSNAFLALIRDSDDVRIYHILMNSAKPMPVARPYSCIGSGGDMADGELSSFFEKKSREGRENVDPVEGISALLNATERASAKNIGVGGLPLINVIRGNEIRTARENNSRLAIEIVKATRAGHLPTEFEHQALKELIYDDFDYKNVEKDMWKQAKDRRALDRLLRGYKA